MGISCKQLKLKLLFCFTLTQALSNTNYDFANIGNRHIMIASHEARTVACADSTVIVPVPPVDRYVVASIEQWRYNTTILKCKSAYRDPTSLSIPWSIALTIVQWWHRVVLRVRRSIFKNRSGKD
ncbi:hypothetical protein QTP88_021384 [Uroleucon formosanum]